MEDTNNNEEGHHAHAHVLPLTVKACIQAGHRRIEEAGAEYYASCLRCKIIGPGGEHNGRSTKECNTREEHYKRKESIAPDSICKHS